MSTPRPWISAAEAATELNVSRATLYAYVSRGPVASRGQPGSRKRLYATADIRRLRAAGDGSGGTPDRALDFGIPILDSAITLIDGGRLYYRGRDAMALAAGTSLETVAGLLWEAEADPFAEIGIEPQPPIAPGIAGAIARLAVGGRTDMAAYARPPAGRGACVPVGGRRPQLWCAACVCVCVCARARARP